MFAENSGLKRCEKDIEVPIGPDFLEDIDYFDHDDLDRGLDKGFEVEYSVNEECLNCLGNEFKLSINNKFVFFFFESIVTYLGIV